MEYKKLIKISIVLNIILMCAILYLIYNFHPKLIPNLIYTESAVEIKESILKNEITKSTIFHNAAKFKILGKLPETDLYARLPKEAKKFVSEPVWKLSRNSAGIAIRFSSNSSSIKIRWTLKDNVVYSNMTPIASKGFDLYTYSNEKWQFVGVAKPSDKIQNESIIIDGMQASEREYLLNLPLYDGVQSLEIGIDYDAHISSPIQNIIDNNKPIVFYGTSITQGASASRPGLTYVALLGRNLNKEIINLGFSGNGKFDKILANYFMSINPSFIVLDCTPNSPSDTIRKNLPDLIEFVRSKNKTVPIFFVESIIRDFSYFKKDDKLVFGTMSFINQQNNTLNEIYKEKSMKHKNLYYINSEKLIGNDHEATIDGTHFNDLGHFRAYEFLKCEIDKNLNKKSKSH